MLTFRLIVIFLFTAGMLKAELHPLPITRSVENIVRERAQAIYALKDQGKITLSQGRECLLQEMQKNPSQLHKDLMRISCFYLGKDSIPQAWYRHKSAKYQFLVIAKLLACYTKMHKPHLFDSTNEGRLGAFWIVEILYAIVQSWSGPALTLAFDNTILSSGEWGNRSGSAAQRISFAFDSDFDDILTVSFISERNMQNLSDIKQKHLNFITESKIYFDLISGSIKFFYSYSIDGLGKARITETI